MRLLTKKVFPLTCLIVTAMTIISALLSVFRQESDAASSLELLAIILGLFLLMCFECYVLQTKKFRFRFAYFLSSFIWWYLGTGLLLFCFHGIGVRRENFFLYTVLFTILYGSVTAYEIHRLKLDAEEINQLLRQKEKEEAG